MLADRSIMEEMLHSRGNTDGRFLAQRCVNVYSDMGSVVREGDVITLTGELVGFDGLDVSLQWQYDDGFFWNDVPGATGLTHSFEATPATVNYSWRLSVSENG